MRSTILSILTLNLTITTSSAQLLPFHHLQQRPMAPSTTADNTDIILSDVLGTQKSINLFTSIVNDISSISTLLDTSSANATVLAPTNSAISSLPRKPWEEPGDYAALGASAYSGKDGEDRAHRNLRRFAQAHVVPTSPWREGDKVENLLGTVVWWEKREDGKAYVMPGSVEVEKVASQVKNGEVWILKGVVNYAS